MRGILSTPASDVHERLKTNGTAIKIARETTDNPFNIYIYIYIFGESYTEAD